MVIGNKYTKILCIVVLFCCMAFIFYMSSQTKSESSQSSSFFVELVMRFFDMEKTDFLVKIVRKCAHMFEYAVLGGTFFSLFCHYALGNRTRFIWSLGLSSFYAATDEIHQLFVKGRACRFSDVCIDSAGSLIGILLAILLIKFFCKLIGEKR